jgi:protoporphyrinogen oxidase
VTDTRIAVIGAGPMGMAAAYQAALDGRKVVVFEAADRIGGMAASFDFNGFFIERYYHFHCTTDFAFFELLKELGIDGALRWAPTRMGYFYKGTLYDWGSPAALLRFPDLSLVEKARYLAQALVASRSNDWKALDNVRAKDWVKGWIGEHAFEVLWTQLFELKFHEFGDDLSAAWIWSRLRRLARSRDRLMRERLGYLEGGSSMLLEALQREVVRRGGEIRLSTPVEKVVVEGGVVRGLEVGGVFHPFDGVISTAPLPYAAKFLESLPSDILERYRSVRYLAVACVIIKMARRLTDKFWINVSDPDMDIPGLVEYTNLRPMSHNVVFIPYYMPAEHPKYSDPDSVFEQKVRGYLKRINPSLEDSDIIDVRVHRYRYAQPVCPIGFGDHLPSYRLPVTNLFVADTSFYYPEDRGISESIDLARKMAREICR